MEDARNSTARWIAANALGQGLALGASGLLGHLSGSRGELDLAVAIGGLAAAGLLEGALLGAAQIWALRLRGAAARRWMAATVGAFVTWWVLGAIASLFEPPAPSRLTVVLVALVAGGALGLLVGALQGRTRPPSRRAAWLGANGAGWAAGLLLAALSAALIPWGPFGGEALAIGALGGLATGALVGAVTAPWRP